MLHIRQIWRILRTHLPRGQWISVNEIYDLVEKYATLDDDDYAPEAPGSAMPKWKRNVRNVLQSRKTSGPLEWDGHARYRMTEEPSTILDSVDRVLNELGRPAHVREIYEAIVSAGLYDFGAQDPIGVVSRKIREQTEANADCKFPRYLKTALNTFALLENSDLVWQVPEATKQLVAKVQERDLERTMECLDDHEFADWVDSSEATTSASLEVKQGLVKVRKYQRSIIVRLKAQYAGACQLCGWSSVEEYGVDISEAHHIEYFSTSLNNKPSNVVILCPNHHSLIHATEATFDRTAKAFVTPAGIVLALMVNSHL